MAITNIRRIGSSIAFNFITNTNYSVFNNLIILPLHLATIQITEHQLVIQPPVIWYGDSYWSHNFESDNDRNTVSLEIMKILSEPTKTVEPQLKTRWDMPTPDTLTELK